MKQIIIIFLLFAVNFSLSLSFEPFNNSGNSSCVFQNRYVNYSVQGTPKHSYDVLKYTFNLDLKNCFIQPFPKSFNAWVQIDFRVDTALNSIQLDAVNSSLIIDSVQLSGITFVHTNNVLSIGLNHLYNPGEIASVKVFYRHKEVSDGAFYNSGGNVSTATEMERSRMWFPCWDKPSDKALTELTANVPTIVKFGSNGSLIDSAITGDTIYYHWKSRDPMSTYLIYIAGRPYVNLDIRYWHKPSNPADSIPIRFYWAYGDNYDSVLFWENKLTDITNFYSNAFCEYPFEKIGFFSSGNQTCMENQTLIDLGPGLWNNYIVSHEFAHHWFGDYITCGTWADVWLNEGFATFVDAFWLEHSISYEKYKEKMVYYAGKYLETNDPTPIYDPPGYINAPHLVYLKAGCVLYMLRYVTGDSLFFSIIRSYMSDTNYTNKNAVTSDFNAKVNQVSGQNYDWFFDEWIYGRLHPKYNVTYSINQQDTMWNLNVFIKQTQTEQFFKMPVEIKVYFSGTDTLFEKVNNDSNNQLFTFTYNKKPLAIIFDPHNNIILKAAVTAIGISNNFKEIPVKFNLYQNFPNPFNPVTTIKYDIPKKSNVTITVYDLLGSEVALLVNNEMKNAGSYDINWNAVNFASGVYIYRIIAHEVSGSSNGDYVSTKKMVLIK